MRLRDFKRDRRGGVAVTVALGSTMLFGMAAFGVDLGTVVQTRRKAQGAADIAAMLAASDPARADQLARRSLADNGFGTGTITVATGRYDASGQVAAPQRFKAGGGPTNAVRVALKSSVQTHFTPILGLPKQYEINAAGTAASVQLAAFWVGSGTAALDGGIANAVLGALLGTRLSLSVSDYNALLNARIDSYRFLDALGARIGLVSYADILAANVRIDQVVASIKAAGGTGLGSASSALDLLLSAGPNGDRFRVGDLVDLGDAAALSPGRGSAGPSVGVMSLVSAAAQLANGNRQVAVDLGATIPGLLRTKLTLGIGERRQYSGWVQPGTPSATVTTAQTRLLIEASLTAPLGLANLNLPIYVEAARAKATLRSVTCPWTAATRRSVGIDVEPGLLDLAIADVGPSSIVPGAISPDLSRDATILAVPLVSITAKARATIGSPYAQTLAFGDDDITARRVKTVSASGMTNSLTRSLIDSMTINLGGLGVTPLLRPALQVTLGNAAPALDFVLDNTLRTLGIRVGYADVAVDGTRCDHAVLVQ